MDNEQITHNSMRKGSLARRVPSDEMVFVIGGLCFGVLP